MERGRLVARGIPLGVAAVAVGALSLNAVSSEPSPVIPEVVRVSTAASGPSTLSGTWSAMVVKRSPTSFTVADAAGPSVALYQEPDVPYAPKPALAHPTHEGLPVVFLVLEEKGPWLRVRVSSRPNDLVLWVKRGEVTLRTVANRVLVEVGARRVTVLHGDEVLLSEPVAVGSPRTPTPLGSFFVDGIVDVPSDNGPYGAFQVSVSGFSEVLQSFGGGVGQIAMHGTNRPDLIGQDISNGCIRMTNDAITRMSQLAPLGTPVTVVA